MRNDREPWENEPTAGGDHAGATNSPGDVVKRHTIGFRRTDMTYETPSITELGSVADFTRGDSFAMAWDGLFSSHILGKDRTPTS